MISRFLAALYRFWRVLENPDMTFTLQTALYTYFNSYFPRISNAVSGPEGS